MNNIYTYDQIIDMNISEVGNKAKNIARLSDKGIKVPRGVAISSSIFYKNKDIEISLSKTLDDVFEKDMKYFCVRSSSLNEDSSDKSFAGQYDTYIGIHRKDLLHYIEKVCNSINNNRALFYRGNIKDSIGILIQEIIPCEYAGILFTRNPISGATDELVLESGAGLGELVVSGEITPDHYVIGKNGEYKESLRGFQDVGLFFENGTIHRKELARRESLLLNNSQVEEIIRIGKKIENIFGYPQDIEWGYFNDKLYILQSRNITT